MQDEILKSGIDLKLNNEIREEKVENLLRSQLSFIGSAKRLIRLLGLQTSNRSGMDLQEKLNTMLEEISEIREDSVTQEEKPLFSFLSGLKDILWVGNVQIPENGYLGHDSDEWPGYGYEDSMDPEDELIWLIVSCDSELILDIRNLGLLSLLIRQFTGKTTALLAVSGKLLRVVFIEDQWLEKKKFKDQNWSDGSGAEGQLVSLSLALKIDGQRVGEAFQALVDDFDEALSLEFSSVQDYLDTFMDQFCYSLRLLEDRQNPILLTELIFSQESLLEPERFEEREKQSHFYKLDRIDEPTEYGFAELCYFNDYASHLLASFKSLKKKRKLSFDILVQINDRNNRYQSRPDFLILQLQNQKTNSETVSRRIRLPDHESRFSGSVPLQRSIGNLNTRYELQIQGLEKYLVKVSGNFKAGFFIRLDLKRDLLEEYSLMENGFGTISFRTDAKTRKWLSRKGSILVHSVLVKPDGEIIDELSAEISKNSSQVTSGRFSRVKPAPGIHSDSGIRLLIDPTPELQLRITGSLEHGYLVRMKQKHKKKNREVH